MKGVLDRFNEVENVIFDLGNVVLDIDIQRGVDALMKLKIGGLVAENIFPKPLKIFEEYERGEISSLQFFEYFVEKYEVKNLNQTDFWSAWNSIFYEFDPRRIELIKKLSENYNVYLLSNTNAEHVKKFNDMFRTQFNEEFCAQFKRCFYSNELKCRKPESEIYNKVIEATGISAQKTVFIDDLEKNVIAARECGLNGHHLVEGETILDIFNY